LYELAAGKRAFQRGSTAEIMTAIIDMAPKSTEWLRRAGVVGARHRSKPPLTSELGTEFECASPAL
jgi:hypothetical protein